MLIDDNPDDNFFHEREINKIKFAPAIVTEESAMDALAYLKSKKENGTCPDLIFLDINMPGMNGWDFLEQYNKLDKELQNGVVIIMLTTSENPDDKAKAKSWSFVSDYITKPLTEEVLQEIITKYFS